MSIGRIMDSRTIFTLALVVWLVAWIIVAYVAADESSEDEYELPLVLKEHKLFESCSIRTLNCTTEEHIIYYECELGQEVKTSDSCIIGLSCQDEICHPDCIPRATSMYDYAKNKCVTKVGAACETYGRDCQKDAICKRNATFQISSYRAGFTCECIPGLQLINGQCTKTVVYGKECRTEDSEFPLRLNCDPNANIICKNDTCQCKSSDQVFLANENRCFAKLNGSCLANRENTGASESICYPGLVCNTSSYSYTCGCSYYGKLSDDGSVCLGKSIYAQCEPENPYLKCDRELKLECQNKYCKCAGGRVLENGVCLHLAGSECDPEVAPMKLGKKFGPCVDNSVCIEGRCLCVDGHSQNANGRCSRSFGQPCNYTNTGPAGSTIIYCNSLHGLSCVEGKCQCTDIHETFNVNTERCEDNFISESYEETMNELYTSGSTTSNPIYFIPAVAVSMIVRNLFINNI